MVTEAKRVALTAPRSAKVIPSESALPEKVASSSPSPEQSPPAPPERTFAGPVFSHSGFFADPATTVPKEFLGVMGMPINAKGEIESENLTLACGNATPNMMTLLQERGLAGSRLMSSAALPSIFAYLMWSTRHTSLCPRWSRDVLRRLLTPKLHHHWRAVL
jgi:hypothetical protein